MVEKIIKFNKSGLFIIEFEIELSNEIVLHLKLHFSYNVRGLVDTKNHHPVGDLSLRVVFICYQFFIKQN